MIQSSLIRVIFGTDFVKGRVLPNRPSKQTRRERMIGRSRRQMNRCSGVGWMEAVQRMVYHRRGRRRAREIVEESNNEKKQGQAHPRPRGGTRYPLPCDENPRGGRSV